jgi:hypothetical protein
MPAGVEGDEDDLPAPFIGRRPMTAAPRLPAVDPEAEHSGAVEEERRCGQQEDGEQQAALVR